MDKEQEQNAVRAVLRNELTWIVVIIGMVWGGVQGVVLPLQKLQVQLAQIQNDIVDYKKNYEKVMEIHQDILNRLTKLEARI